MKEEAVSGLKFKGVKATYKEDDKADKNGKVLGSDRKGILEMAKERRVGKE